MYNSYTSISNNKDNEFGPLGKIASIALIVLLIVLMFCGYIATKDYDLEVEALLVSNELITHERNSIGYVSTEKQSNIVVYDSPYIRDYYNATYSYMVNGREYSFILKTHRKPKENMSIWVNSESPNNFVLDGVKCHPSDFLPIVN